jgi:hypothetical protein
LFTLLPPDHLIDTFSRIFAYVDTKVPALFIAAANIQPVFQQQPNNSNSPDSKGLRKGQPTFVFPKTNEGKRQFLLEVEAMTKILNSLDGVRPWEFAAINVIERQLEYSMNQSQLDIDTDSNPATSETISVSDDVLSTSGDGENTNTVSAGTTDTASNMIDDVSSTTLKAPITATIGDDTDTAPSESPLDTTGSAKPSSVAVSSSEIQDDHRDAVMNTATTAGDSDSNAVMEKAAAPLSSDNATTATRNGNTTMTNNDLLNEKTEANTTELTSTDDTNDDHS